MHDDCRGPMSKLHILLADDEKPARFGMKRALTHENYVVSEAEDGVAALEAIRTRAPDLVFLDLNMPGLDGQSVLRELGTQSRSCEIIMVTANDSVATAVECIRLGAVDYITKPFEVERLRTIARRVAERVALQSRVAELQAQLEDRQAFGALVGISRPMRQLYQQMVRAARAPVDILIRGETGTGKELIAREIHRLSPRASGPFIAVNTAAIAESLAESELFGHKRGAFTGADRDREGVFEQADGGTLFLDEIGDMPVAAQTRILRALQERSIQPVGSTAQIQVDVRIVCATHQDLEEAISAGQFRQDLYYRIRGIELRVPPLRARREDILLLADYFLERATGQTTTTPPRLAGDAVDVLLSHSWPGNVRELQQMLTAAAAMTETEEIHSVDLGLSPGVNTEDECQEFAAYSGLPLTEAKTQLVEAFERVMIREALGQHAGNVSAAARQLGIHRQSLQQKMTQLGIER